MHSRAENRFLFDRLSTFDQPQQLDQLRQALPPPCPVLGSQHATWCARWHRVLREGTMGGSGHHHLRRQLPLERLPHTFGGPHPLCKQATPSANAALARPRHRPHAPSTAHAPVAPSSRTWCARWHCSWTTRPAVRPERPHRGLESQRHVHLAGAPCSKVAEMPPLVADQDVRAPLHVCLEPVHPAELRGLPPVRV